MMSRKKASDTIISILIPELIIILFVLLSNFRLVSLNKINYLLPLAITISGLIYLKVKKIPLSPIGIRKEGWGKSLFYSLILVTIFLMYTIFTNNLSLSFKEGNLIKFIIFSIPLSLIIALGEELWMRGIIFYYLEKLKSEEFAFVISSLIFGLSHFRHGLSSIISGLIIGFSFGFVRLKTKNILGLVFSHGLYVFIYSYLLI
jgi:membrane protease YdiL (CAAX protease family)